MNVLKSLVYKCQSFHLDVSRILHIKKWQLGVPWWPSRLRIWCCHCYGSGSCYGADYVPGPRNSESHRHAPLPPPPPEMAIKLFVQNFKLSLQTTAGRMKSGYQKQLPNFWLSEYSSVCGKKDHPILPKYGHGLVSFEPCETLKYLCWGYIKFFIWLLI